MKRADARQASAAKGGGHAARGAALALLSACLGQTASANPDLARDKGCLGCHAVDRRVVGPGFAEVAQRYAGKPAAQETVSRHIREGLKGAWGDMPMPAQPHVKPAEAEALARWLLGTGG